MFGHLRGVLGCVKMGVLRGKNGNKMTIFRNKARTL
jgi:hypothetical protein